MPLYMSQFSYTPEAWATLAKNPQDRRAPLTALALKVGAKIHNFYYAFGDFDGVVIFEAPNDKAAASLSIAAVTPGHIKAIKTTPLMTVEDAMEVMRLAGEASFTAPTKR